MVNDLTDTEISILIMLADGSSVTDISMEIGKARCTIKHYIVNLKRKLGATNITHAVALAYHKGILNASR